MEDKNLTLEQEAQIKEKAVVLLGREGGRCRVTGNKDEGASVQISVTQDDFVSRGYTLDGNGKDQSCRLPATCPHLSDRLLSVFSSLVVSYTK